MTQILRGFSQGLSNLAQGVASASEDWPAASINHKRLEQQAIRDNAQIDRAKKQAEALAAYRGETLQIKRLEIELSPLYKELERNQAIQLELAKEGIRNPGADAKG